MSIWVSVHDWEREREHTESEGSVAVKYSASFNETDNYSSA